MSWFDSTHGDVSMPSLVYAGVTALSKAASSKKHSAIRVESQQVARHIEESQRKNQEAAKQSANNIKHRIQKRRIEGTKEMDRMMAYQITHLLQIFPACLY